MIDDVQELSCVSISLTMTNHTCNTERRVKTSTYETRLIKNRHDMLSTFFHVGQSTGFVLSLSPSQ